MRVLEILFWIGVGLAAIAFVMFICLPLGVVMLIVLDKIFGGALPSPAEGLMGLAAFGALWLMAVAAVTYLRKRTT